MTNSATIASYPNYPRFRPGFIDLSDFPGPMVGDSLVNVELFDLQGESVQLESFLGEPIVLEMGSYTCPMYNNDVVEMNRLAKEFPDVHFLVMYIREAHPGERVRAHRCFEDKLALAKLIKEDEPNRRVLIDTTSGDAHRVYGALPNSVHVFDEKGVVVYRSDWSNVEVVEKVLASMSHKSVRFAKDHFEKRPPMGVAFSILLRGGWLAVADLFLSIPGMIRAHIKASKSFGAERSLTRSDISRCC